MVINGSMLRTPQNVPYALPTQVLAEAIADEWQGQKEVIEINSMPLSMIINLALDHVESKKGEVIDTIIRYATTDLLCYRTDHPGELSNLQEQEWQPLLDWAAIDLGIRLKTTVGIIPVEQDTEAIVTLRNKLAEYDHFRLAALQILTNVFGSIIIALSVSEFHIDAAQAFELSRLDDNYQFSKWGEDVEAREGNELARNRAELAAKFLTLLKGKK